MSEKDFRDQDDHLPEDPVDVASGSKRKSQIKFEQDHSGEVVVSQATATGIPHPDLQ